MTLSERIAKLRSDWGPFDPYDEDKVKILEQTSAELASLGEHVNALNHTLTDLITKVGELNAKSHEHPKT